jgi:hypothetical protein
VVDISNPLNESYDALVTQGSTSSNSSGGTGAERSRNEHRVAFGSGLLANERAGAGHAGRSVQVRGI